MLDITIPSVLKVHVLSHSISMMENTIQAKNLNCSHIYSTGMPLDYTVQKTSNAWTAHAMTASFALPIELVPPYILFDSEMKGILVLSKQEQIFAPCEQSLYHLHEWALSTKSLMWALGAEQNYPIGCYSLARQQPLFGSYRFGHLRQHALHNKNCWTRFAHYALLPNKLPAVFQVLPSSMPAALGVTRPLLPAKIVVDVESKVPEMSNTDVVDAKALPPNQSLA